ncbi:hypothetical protein NIIDNTM18_06740 [Mycolicibacterium litorale]|uniref:Uncharacterized protein n=1 Tax=Mycolicibacterium litorale TaxID=758802 RepID=A0A6S6P0E8_9MYCO|nr:hypothetical protein NIIDNTM18_06740 [Mycolicibacterium litorale]
MIATSSRGDYRARATNMGADAVVDHHRLLAAADLADGVLRTTVTRTIEDCSAAGLNDAQRGVGFTPRRSQRIDAGHATGSGCRPRTSLPGLASVGTPRSAMTTPDTTVAT